MKKGVAIAGVIVVGAGVWLGTTWYTGKRIEAEVPARLAEINTKLAEALPKGYTAEIKQVSYERGFFSTHARYAFTLSSPAIGDEKPVKIEPGMLEIDSTIQHGPFPNGAISQGRLLPSAAFIHAELAPTETLRPLFALAGGKVPLWSDTVVDYRGDGTAKGGIAPMKLQQDGLSLVFSGASVESAYQHADQAIQGHARAGSLIATSPDSERFGKIVFNGMALDMDTHMGQSGLSVGDTALSIKRIELQGKQYPVSLDDLGYTAKVGEDGKLLHGEADYRLGKLTVGTTAMGGGQTTIKIANLDGAAAKKLADSYKDLATASMSMMGADTVDPAVAETLLPRAIEDVRALLASGPVVTIDPILWKTDKGEGRITYALTLQPFGDGKLSPQQMLRQAIKSLQIHATVPQAMAQDLLARGYVASDATAPELAAKRAGADTQSALDMGKAMNVVRVDNGNIVADFAYDGAKATLNGREVPIDSLLADESETDDDDEAAQLAANAAAEAAAAAAQDATATPADPAMTPASPEADDETGPAQQAGEVLHLLNGDTVGAMVNSAGYAYTAGTDDDGDAALTVTPQDKAVSSLEVQFGNCDDDKGCDNIMLQAVYKKITPLPQKAINAWNQNSRWVRAYLDDAGQPTLEMDINAYGGIGKEGVDALVQTFFSDLTDFADAIKPVHKGK